MAGRFKATTAQRPCYAFGEPPSLYQVPQRFCEAPIKSLKVLKSACSAGLTCLSGAGNVTNLTLQKTTKWIERRVTRVIKSIVMWHTTKVAKGNLHSRQ